MKINALKIDGYGVCKGLGMEGLADGLSVLYGPNEAGKTTLLQFIRSMLYGFSAQRAQYFPPVHGGQAGGMIDVSGAPGRFEIARHLQEGGAGAEELVITAPDGTRQGEHLVKILLSNIDEAIFNNVFAVELREMQELATLSDTEAAELLYNLTAGLDRVSLVEALRELETSRNLILDAAGKQSQLMQLWGQREKLRLEIKELGAVTRRWCGLAAETAQSEGDLNRLEEDKNQVFRQLRVAELALSIGPRWSQRKALGEQLAALGKLPPMPEGAIERLDSINARLKKNLEHIEALQDRGQALSAECATLKINEPLHRHAARIEAWLEQESWLVALRNQIQEINTEIAALQGELNAEWQGLGLSAMPGNFEQSLTRRTIAALRSPARKMRSSRSKLKQAKREEEKAAKTAEELSKQIESALSARGETDLGAALDRCGGLVAQYRRRVQIDERLDQLARHQRELEEQSHSLVEHQLLSVGVLAGLGAAFILGVMLILTGLFMPASIIGSAGWTLALLGLVGGGGGVLGKYILEKTHSARLDSCQKHLTIIQSQIQQTKSEREQLDAQLPRGGGPIVSRLQAAEKDLAALEELAPLESKRNAARQQAAAAAQCVTQGLEEVKTARRQWREALAAAQLPTELSPRQVRRLFNRRTHLAEAQHRMDQRREELQRRRQEWESFATRVLQTAADAGIKLEGADLIEHLKQLGAAAAQQQAMGAQREAVRRHIRHIRLRRAKHEEAISRLKHRRRELFFQAGAEEEAEFRHHVLQRARADLLRRDLDALNQEIAAAIGEQCSLEALGKQLEEQSAAEIEARAASLRQRQSVLEAQIRECLEKRGQLNAQMQVLADDRQLSVKQLELAVVEERIEEAWHRWQVLATACRIMERIRAVYERERQPETLQEASLYLQRLTQGRYQRVWTPLGQNVLRVDDAEGHCLAVEMLSRGTREQLFLSLRMALAAGYARRGAALPMVLDDVLVNFDAERAAAAAAVLSDFSQAGHQLLVFTCHEHIAKIFAELGSPVASLPPLMHGDNALICFEIPTEKASKEIKRFPGRTATRRKNAAKVRTLTGEDVEVENQEEEIKNTNQSDAA